MKLPEDKQERMKIFALIGIGVLIVIVLAYLGIKSLRESKSAKIATLEELHKQQKSANIEINMMSRDNEVNRETVTEIIEISDKYVLRPVLGNYLLKAKEILKKYEKELDIKFEEIRDSGISAVPHGARVYNIYTTRIRVECSYHDLIRVIREIEADNPYSCVTTISIATLADDPEKHTINFDVQWPVWADPEKSVELVKQLKDIGESEEAAEEEVGRG